ncbi:hypothetical protein [Mucilaginibacter sp. KACC 22063]|uniref:hypothetical protein n=1 Tax=Mucilaginibacter sp. KACC 22063 TaxID=3025666 RepID=UPI00236508C6|nr:hypothetical protein [Mucilaginibacter sp. KACC 22063]WDF55513.1 hypothetical protein PQ461_00380 [Mucilaginibacter sp. KACC 22063]
MRIFLLVFLMAVGTGASAQWRIFKKHERFPQIPQVVDNSFTRFTRYSIDKVSKLPSAKVSRSDYSLELEENYVMKTAQHNMRFRVYDEASYNFSNLAQLYLQQNRYSEAKWFFLQSNNISRQQNNDKLTIANLVWLAGIKSEIGDFKLAQQDLTEARQMASSHGWHEDIAMVDQKLKYIQSHRVTTKVELRYAGSIPVGETNTVVVD